jgi:hypothetical protein
VTDGCAAPVQADQSGDETVFTAHVAEVVIAAPDDTGRLRNTVDQTLNWWNSARAERDRIVLLPSCGRQHTTPEGLDHADNLDRCDVFIAIIDPSRRSVDDAIADVLRAKRAGKFALAWFVAQPPPNGLNTDDQAWLSDATQRLTKEGIVPRYVGHGDSLFDSDLQSAISADLTYATLSTLAGRFDSASAARQVTTDRTPVGLLGSQIWAVTVINSGNSLVTGLTVSVDAVDSEGNDVPDGAHRSEQPLAEVFAKLRTGRWPDEHFRPISGPGAVSPRRGQGFLTQRIDLLAAHTALNFPRWLRSNQHASALYALEPNASLRVRVQFEDEAGRVWSRMNDAEPERVSPSSVPLTGERRRAAVTSH